MPRRGPKRKRGRDRKAVGSPTGVVMTEAFLEQYASEEIAFCQDNFQSICRADAPLSAKIRRLYSIPAKKKTLYYDSPVTTQNLVWPPEDRTLVVPVFKNAHQNSFERNFGPTRRFFRQCEDGRLFPVIQNPVSYSGLEYISPLFTQFNSPATYIRGAFVYALIFGLDPRDIVFRSNGVPLMRRMHELVDRCGTDHHKWIRRGMKDKQFWETFYQKNEDRTPEFDVRLREGLLYRYASVAMFIGEACADELVRLETKSGSGDSLLSLHLLFDHMLCHGFLSDQHQGTRRNRCWTLVRKVLGHVTIPICWNFSLWMDQNEDG